MHSCPQCGRHDSRLSMQSGLTDFLLRALLLAPFRCRCCRARFYRFMTPEHRRQGLRFRPR
jgi:hypothetical protein